MLSNIDELNLLGSFYTNPSINDMKQDEKDDYKYILAFIASLMLEYTITEEKLVLSRIEQAKEYKKANDMIDNTFSSEIKSEDKSIADILKETLQKLANFRFEQSKNVWKVSNKDFQNILNAKIEGKNYSDRIYDNKNKVAKVLKKQIKDFINGKTSVNEIKDLMQSKFDLNTFNTDRLVDNEISRVCRALDEYYFATNSDDIEELIYNGRLDSRICEHCFSLDGNAYKVDDANRPTLPQHCKCRCFYSVKYKGR